jgi:hypothetical protein
MDDALKESRFGLSRFDAFLLASNPLLSALLKLQTNKKNCATRGKKEKS